jgi:hypothetical protein
MLHAPQYKSNIFPSKFQSILNAVQNNFSAHKVLVWKKEKGEILNVNCVSLFCSDLEFSSSLSSLFNHTNIKFS